jgi:hypothetical protein
MKHCKYNLLTKEKGSKHLVKEKKSFQLLHCWNILRHEPKWHQKMSQMAENKSCQKKNKAVDDSIIDLTGNQNGDLPNAGNNDITTPEGDAPK